MMRMMGDRRPLLVAVMFLTISVSTAACGADVEGGDQGVPLSSVDASADVDPEAGTVVLPVERFLMTRAETHLVDTASQTVFDQCVRDHGYEVVSTPVVLDSEGDRRYGTWLVQEAELYGFAPPSVGRGAGEPGTVPVRPRDSDGHPIFPPGDVRNADLDVILECHEAPEVLRFVTHSIEPAFDYGAEIGPLMDEALGSSEGKQVFADWEACLEEHGLERDESESPYSIRGATMDVTEQNIAMALVDVQCKTDVELVQRLADLEAELQAPVVARYFKELTAMRAEYDVVLEDARAFLASDAVS